MGEIDSLEKNCNNNKTTAGTPHQLSYSLLVGVLAFICYANSSYGHFVFDDSEAILDNKDVDPSSTSLQQVFRNDFWGTRISSNTSHKSYRPLTVITFRLNHWLAGGLDPFGFHLTNVVLHVVVSLLYMELCTAICRKSTLSHQHATMSPAVAAVLFAVHPIHTESVAGIVGRAELMSAICFFLALFCYIRACDSDSGSSWWSMVCWLVLTALLVGCALLFKEQGITVVGVCIVYDIILNVKADPVDLLQLKFCVNKKADLSRVAIRVSLILAVTVAMFVARLSTGAPTFKPIDNAASFADSLVTRVLSYNYIYALNAWLLLNPWWLCFDWSMGCIPLVNSLSDFRVVAIAVFWLIFITLILYCVLAEKGPLKRLVTFSLAMLVVPFLPASNVFIRVGFVVAERVLYLPSAGYCLLVALGVVAVGRYFSKWVWCGMVYVVAVFTIHSIIRSSQWLNEEDLFVSGITVCPHNAKVLYNIGKVRSDAGDTETGIAAYREAIRLFPEYDQALNNLGNILKEQGDAAEAEKLFLRALTANQKYPAAWMNLGIAQVSLGKLKEAEESYKTAIKHRKRYPDAYYNLGNLYKDMSQHRDAIAAYETAIGLKMDHTSAWNNLGLLYEDLRMYDKAEEVMRRAISEIPNCAQFYSSLGVLLGRQDRLEEGQNLLEKAVALEPNSGNYHANLGVVYHLKKDYKRAEDAYALALRLQPDLTLAKENFNKLLSTRKSS